MRQLTQRHAVKYISLLTALFLAPGVGYAIPFSTDLSIQAFVGLDGASLAPNSGTQTGALSMISGGAASMSTIDGITVTGSNPLGGALTDIGDSVGIEFNVAGTELDTEFYGNYGFTLANSSATDTYMVTLGFESVNIVNVIGNVGDAVYIESKMFLTDSFADLFYTYRYVDLMTNEDLDETCNGCLFMIDLTLGAGDIIDLYGNNDIFGSAFDPGTGYEASLSTLISVLDVANLTAPPTVVPEPETLVLFAVGVLMLVTVSKQRTMKTSDEYSFQA